MSGLESYAHRAAKEVFAGWLREVASEAREYASLGGISWRVNRGGPSWGVWLEYPIMPGPGWGGPDGCVWDETAIPSSGEDLSDSPWRHRPPTYDECIEHYGKAPRWIVDIAIQHKGTISAVVEIVHKNPPSPEKIQSLAACTFASEVWVIPARWVLGQVKRPKRIPIDFCAADCNGIRVAA